MALSKSVGSSSWALQDFIICALQPSSESTVARVQLQGLCQNQPLLQRALRGSDIQSWKSRVWNRIPKIPEAHSKVPIQSKISRPADVQNVLKSPLESLQIKRKFQKIDRSHIRPADVQNGPPDFQNSNLFERATVFLCFFLFNLTISIDQQNRQKIAKSDWQPSCQCSSPNKYHNGGKSTLSRPTNVKRFTIKLVYRRNWSLVSEG